MTREQAIRAQLVRLGIPTHRAGFPYIEQAIALWVPGCMVTKDIYPVIARNNRVSIDAVERNIRAAIKQAWDEKRGRTDAIFGVFGLWAVQARPTASEFISAVAIWAERGERDED